MNAPSAVLRIRHPEAIHELVNRSVSTFDLGTLTSFVVIEAGLDDCNLCVVTTAGKYLLKVLSAAHDAEAVRSYLHILDCIDAAQIGHPAIHRTTSSEASVIDAATGNTLLFMDYVDGQTYDKLNRVPTKDELSSIAEQIAKLHAIECRPPRRSDSWAVAYIDAMYESVQRFIEPDYQHAIDVITQRMRAIQQMDLPHAFVHSDIAKTNVIVADSGPPVVIDYGSASYLPRLQDLAVIAANLMYFEGVSLEERTHAIAESYSQSAELTAFELTALERSVFRDYALGAIAMEYLGSLKQLHINNNSSPETLYWLELGRSQLRTEL